MDGVEKDDSEKGEECGEEKHEKVDEGEEEIEEMVADGFSKHMFKQHMCIVREGLISSYCRILVLAVYVQNMQRRSLPTLKDRFKRQTVADARTET
jgi:hypothetical protein